MYYFGTIKQCTGIQGRKVMKNGYFQLVEAVGGFGIKLIPPEDGGESIRIADIMWYLDNGKVDYNLETLQKAIAEEKETVCFLGRGECPAFKEDYRLNVSADNMTAVVRFFPPTQTGKRMTFDDFFKDLRFRNITSGIQMDVLQDHFQSSGIYGTDLVIAQGRKPRNGTDARIEYYFNTDVHVQPTMREDGSVDYFHLNVINHCKKGDVLARIIPADEGDDGLNILGNHIRPRTVHKCNLKFGNNIELSEDRLSISSKVDGHVMLVEDKVFVSDVYEVENVDISTGNIEFTGSVQVNGNVASNFEIRAEGNVIINGIVEGACIYAGGNIIIARGMNGMSKGILKAGGNIVAKFLENTKAEAAGYVHAESILHTDVSAGTEITVTGRKGFVAGGHVQAGNKIAVRTLGAAMGTPTIVEVGVSPQIKRQYMNTQKEISELVKAIKDAQPIIANFKEKRAKGATFSEAQVNYVKGIAKAFKEKNEELTRMNAIMQELQQAFDPEKTSSVEVQDFVYAGTTIIIGDASMLVHSSYEYCKFERRSGEVKMLPM